MGRCKAEEGCNAWKLKGGSLRGRWLLFGMKVCLESRTQDPPWPCFTSALLMLHTSNASILQRSRYQNIRCHSLTADVEGKGAINAEAWSHETARQAATPPLHRLHVGIFIYHKETVPAAVIPAVRVLVVLSAACCISDQRQHGVRSDKGGVYHIEFHFVFECTKGTHRPSSPASNDLLAATRLCSEAVETPNHGALSGLVGVHARLRISCAGKGGGSSSGGILRDAGLAHS